MGAHMLDGTTMFETILYQKALVVLGLLAIAALWSKVLAVRRTLKAIP
jgi:hypothetical protein